MTPLLERIAVLYVLAFGTSYAAPLLYTVKDLGRLQPGLSRSAGCYGGPCLNDRGQVAGTSEGGRAVRYTEGVGWEDLGVLPGASSSSGQAINNLGQVVGNSGGHSFRYTDGIGMEVLGSGGPTATGINDFGQVSGTRGRRAVRYTDGVGWEGLGVLPGAESSSGEAINTSVR